MVDLIYGWALTKLKLTKNTIFHYDTSNYENMVSFVNFVKINLKNKGSVNNKMEPIT